MRTAIRGQRKEGGFWTFFVVCRFVLHQEQQAWSARIGWSATATSFHGGEKVLIQTSHNSNTSESESLYRPYEPPPSSALVWIPIQVYMHEYWDGNCSLMASGGFKQSAYRTVERAWNPLSLHAFLTSNLVGETNNQACRVWTQPLYGYDKRTVVMWNMLQELFGKFLQTLKT